MAERIPIFFDVSTMRLRAAQKQLDITRAKTRGLSTSAGFLNTQFKQLGATLLATFGAVAVLAAFRNILKSLKDLEFQMSKVAAISGATSKQMVELRDNAIKVGAASKFTATEVGKLQEELARLGFTVTEILKLTDAISALAIVADRELGPTALAVAKTINAFSLSATEADRVVNIMAESFANSALDLEKFEAAIRNVGPLARVAGLSLEKTTAILGLFVDNGIEASKAGTDLRRILLNISKAGITLDEALEQVNLSTNKVTTAQEIFGDRAAVAGIILAENTQKVERFTESLSDSTREIDRMRRLIEDNLETDLKKLASAFDALIQKGSPLNDVFRELVNNTRDWINVLSGVDPTILELQQRMFDLNVEIRKINESDLSEFEKEVRSGNLKRELIDIKALLQFEEFIRDREIERKAQIIENALEKAFASDDIELFIKNLQETAEKEEIIGFIRRQQKDELDQLNIAEALRLELREKAIKLFFEEAKARQLIPPTLEELAAEVLTPLTDEELEDELRESRLDRIRDSNDEEVEEFEITAEELKDIRDKEAEDRKEIREQELQDKLDKLDADTEITEAIIALARGATDASRAFGIENTAFGKSLFLFQKAAALADVIVRGVQERAVIGATSPDPITKAIRITAQRIRQTVGIGTIIGTTIAGFKEGVIDYRGQGTTTSDSNLVMLSDHESIIKASASQKSKKLLEAINSEKINDDLSDILLNNKISLPGNGDVVDALGGVNNSIKNLPISQNIWDERGYSNYMTTKNAKIKRFRDKYRN